MSELPWENKKIAEIMSSVEDEQSSANASGEKKSSTPPIPDILANAFADIPMEEAKIEISEENPSSTEAEVPQAAFPSFGDLPDLSALGNTPPNVPLSEEKEAPLEMPPFMNSPPNADELGMIPPLNQSPESSPTMEKPAKKRSPPPLFEPFINSDEPYESSSPEVGESALPFSPEPIQSQPIDAQVEVPPFPTSDTPVSTGAPVESNPFESTPDAIPPVNPFASAGGPVESNPFESTPDAIPPGNPFTSAGGSVESNPFEPTPDTIPSGNPFASAGGPVEPNPFESTPDAIPPGNPFASAGGPVASNPFEPTPDTIPSGNPFASAGGPVEPNPFESTHEAFQSQNPFGVQVASDTGSFENNRHSQKLPVKLPIDMGSFKKNLEGISGITKGFLKNLTKGKSLIERMEDMREEVDVAESVRHNAESKPAITSNASPFDANPFELSENTNVHVNPFMENEDDGTVSAIRQVTPIENPILEMREEYLLDKDDFGNNASIDALSGNGELTADASISSIDAENSSLAVNDMITDAVTKANSSDNMPGSNELFIQDYGQDSFLKQTELEAEGENALEVSAVPDEVSIQEKTSSTSGMELSRKVFTKELNDIRTTTNKKFEDVEGDLGGLKESLSDMNLHISSIHAEIEGFSNKISEITGSVASAVSSSENILSQSNSRFDAVDGKVAQVENKISEFDSSISMLQSDNVSMKTDLSQIDESISELVGSYTALLAQLHESLQENESKFAVLAELSSKIDSFGPRVELIEKMQEESRSTSKEFSRSMSSMVDNLGKVSSEFQEFRQETEEKNTAVLEKLDSLTEYMESELKKLGARSYKGFGQNVHLSNIVKNSSNMKLCMEWLEFLMELVGRNNLPDILSYYEELGWITEKVRMELLHYAEGIDFYMEKPDWKLTPDDHVKSIWFIESLAGMKVDKNRLSVIERDIEKVKKGSEIYGI
jgi:Putative archaeal flagellar protein D/E